MLNRSERIADILAGVLTTLVLLVLYAPVFISAIFSVVQVNDGRIMWETFSLQNYVSMWSNPSVVDALSNTAIVAASAVAIASLLAVLLAPSRLRRCQRQSKPTCAGIQTDSTP